jgi:GNAT superfamily N-acetyltransferase
MSHMVTSGTERSAIFPDGSSIEMRPLARGDGRRVSQFRHQLSEESEYFRFLSGGGSQTVSWVPRLLQADQIDNLAHGAFACNRFGSILVAIAESIRYQDRPEWAEFAMVAIDPWQGMGIGSLLARHLATTASATGIRFWEAYMLSENRRMERLLDRIGTKVETRLDSRLVVTVRDISSV